jgi:predicted nuclease of restriction endonuclease-like (RecB) superfamily
LLDKLKDFLIELGRGFCFVGSEYLLQACRFANYLANSFANYLAHS